MAATRQRRRTGKPSVSDLARHRGPHPVRVDEETRKQVLQALEDPRFQWRTVSGLGKELGISHDTVQAVLTASDDVVVKYPVPSKDGRDLYTTRAHFVQKAPGWMKFLGALKSRLV